MTDKKLYLIRISLNKDDEIKNGVFFVIIFIKANETHLTDNISKYYIHVIIYVRCIWIQIKHEIYSC